MDHVDTIAAVAAGLLEPRTPTLSPAVLARDGADGIRVSPTVSIPLRRALLCLDCDYVFALGPETCPECGAREWFPLERFFSGSARQLVRLHDVLHEAANGLTPARVRAELLAGVIRNYLETMSRHTSYHTLMLGHAARIVEAIDETMRRLRAMGQPRNPEPIQESPHG